jgi:hypothetical protein
MMTFDLPWTTLVANTDVNSKRFFPASGWIDASQVGWLRGFFEQLCSQANFRCVFAYQVANADGVPTATYELGTALSADGANNGTLTDVSANTYPGQLVRIGWNVWYNAGGTPPLFARCGGRAHYTRK